MAFAELGQAQPESWSQWLRRFSPDYSLPPAGSMPQYPGIRQAVPMGPMEFFFTHQPVWESATRVPPMKSWPGIIPGPPAQTPEDKAMETATMLFGLASGGAAASARGMPEMFAGQVPPRPGFTRLWRAEGIPNPELQGIVSPALEWLRDDPDFQAMQRASGRWWAYTPEETMWYAKHRGDWSEIGAQLRHTDVPFGVAQDSRVSRLPAEHPARLFSRNEEREAFLPQKPPEMTPTPLYQGPLGPLAPRGIDQPWRPEKPSGSLREQATKLLKSERGAVGPKKPGYYDSLRGRWITPETGYDPLTGRRTTPKASEPTQQKVDPLLGRRPKSQQPESTPSAPPSPMVPPPKDIRWVDWMGSTTRGTGERRMVLTVQFTDGTEIRENVSPTDLPRIVGTEIAKSISRQEAEQIARSGSPSERILTQGIYRPAAPLGGQPATTTASVPPPPTPGALHDPLAGLSPQDAAAIQQKLVGGQSEPFAGTPFGRQYEYDPRVKSTQEAVPEFPSALTQQSGLAGAFGPVGEGAFSGVPTSSTEAAPSRFTAPELNAVYQHWQIRLQDQPWQRGLGLIRGEAGERAFTALDKKFQAGRELTPRDIAAALTDEATIPPSLHSWSDLFPVILDDVKAALGKK